MFNVFFYFYLNAQMKHVHDTFKVLQFCFHLMHSLQYLTRPINLGVKDMTPVIFVK